MFQFVIKRECKFLFPEAQLNNKRLIFLVLVEIEKRQEKKKPITTITKPIILPDLLIILYAVCI